MSSPLIYRTFQRGISTPQGRRLLPEQYLQLSPETRLLDIGCANGRFLDQLPKLEYVGFDPSESYIASAIEDYGDRGTFLVGTTETIDRDAIGSFDAVVARGVLHHLDDSDADLLAKFAASVLRPNGRFVTLDPCRLEPQRPIARFLVDRDRGQNVRSPDAYREIVGASFADAATNVHHQLLRVPYDHAVVTASQPSGR